MIRYLLQALFSCPVTRVFEIFDQTWEAATIVQGVRGLQVVLNINITEQTARS